MNTTSATAAPAIPAPGRETLFTLSEDLLVLDELLTESGGELTPEVELWMVEYQAKFAEKVDALGWFIRTCEARSAGLKAHAATIRQQAEDVAAKGKAEENKIVRVKEYVRTCLAILGETRVKGEVYSLGIENNGGTLPLVVEEPFKAFPEKLPAALRRIRYEPDLDALRKLAEASGGEIVVKAEKEGETDVTIARVPPRGTHVRLR